MLTVGRLARKFALSRATILYYEREGLLQPAYRSENGYRWYGDKEIDRLKIIVNYRSYGVPVGEIRELLERGSELAVEQALHNRFDRLELEIRELRKQQKAIVGFLEHTRLQDESGMTPERWSDIMRAAGMSDEDMKNWHRQFEAREPDAHREFLESLNLDAREIERIRKWSREPAGPIMAPGNKEEQ